jgi:hypothetical protein
MPPINDIFVLLSIMAAVGVSIWYGIKAFVWWATKYGD